MTRGRYVYFSTDGKWYRTRSIDYYDGALDLLHRTVEEWRERLHLYDVDLDKKWIKKDFTTWLWELTSFADLREFLQTLQEYGMCLVGKRNQANLSNFTSRANTPYRAFYLYDEETNGSCLISRLHRVAEIRAV